MISYFHVVTPKYGTKGRSKKSKKIDVPTFNHQKMKIWGCLKPNNTEELGEKENTMCGIVCIGTERFNRMGPVKSSRRVKRILMSNASVSVKSAAHI